ncbi:UNVERIFIED_CONTAM: hypothetical protein Slati_1106700 [Sesamum latifolium]|uniref:RNase H type-1 domain-containing protein n=1 Tax=Sesamum latifolium TaxID=2727402 RepID=A0AAW2XGH5_9LAMI
MLKGWRNIVLEGDYQDMIKRLNSNEDDNSPVGLIINDARQLMRSFATCEVSYNPRAFNSHAHALVIFARQNSYGREVKCSLLLCSKFVDLL